MPEPSAVEIHECPDLLDETDWDGWQIEAGQLAP
jgi:hypothetical protein